MATLDTASLASTFLINTPIGASPRGDIIQDSKASWAFAASTTPAPVGDSCFLHKEGNDNAIHAPAPISQRSVSTLSFGDNQDFTDQATPRLARYMSEDIMGLLYNSTANVQGETRQDNSWGGLNCIREGSNEPGSPTNVDNVDLALTRGKSSDYMLQDALLFRNRSEDLPMLLARATSESFSGLNHIVNQRIAQEEECNAQEEEQHESATSHTDSKKQVDVKEESDSDEAGEEPTRSGEESSDTETRRVAAFLAQEASNARRFSARNAGKPKRKIVDSEEEWSDDEYLPKGRKSKRAKKSSAAGAPRYSHNNRGAHVKGRPEMQETARRGQEHWARQVQELREKWREEQCNLADPAFKGQLELLARRHIKSQHECLLRCLHIATANGMVKPASYNNAEGKSFLGWTGFTVVPKRAQEFRAMVEDMFPSPLLENTLHNTFRRAGLVPGSWGEAWLGLSPFVFKKPTSGH